MKKYMILILVFLIFCITVCMFNNTRSDVLILNHNVFDPCYLNIDDLDRIKRTTILNNSDPGRNPDYNSFGVLGTLVYPLSEIDILDNDEVFIAIKPSPSVKNDEVDVYVAHNIEKIQQSKNELCYFKTPPGTTPAFYVSVYKNGEQIIKDTGIFAIHLSYLEREFKPVKLGMSQG